MKWKYEYVIENTAKGAQVVRNMSLGKSEVRGGGDHSCFHVVLYEDDPRWNVMREELRKGRDYKFWFKSVCFSEEELASASWYVLDATNSIWLMGPQWDSPKVFDRSRQCVCGYGHRQIGPLTIKQSKRLETHQFATFEETSEFVFVKDDAANEIKRRGLKGFQYREVMVRNRRPTPTCSMLQLDIETCMDVNLLYGKLDSSKCRWCRTRKYSTHVSLRPVGIRKPRVPRAEQVGDILLSREFIGADSALCYRLMIVSRRFVDLYKELGWKGLEFRPILEQ